MCLAAAAFAAAAVAVGVPSALSARSLLSVERSYGAMAACRRDVGKLLLAGAVERRTWSLGSGVAPCALLWLLLGAKRIEQRLLLSAAEYGVSSSCRLLAAEPALTSCISLSADTSTAVPARIARRPWLVLLSPLYSVELQSGL